MSTTTFDEIAAAARKLSKEERDRLVDMLQESVDVPEAALLGIEAGLADLNAGRVATPEQLAAIASKMHRFRTA